MQIKIENHRQRFSYSKKAIIAEFERIRMCSPILEIPKISQIARNLGYAIDQNGSNSHVMKVIRQYLSHKELKGLD